MKEKLEARKEAVVKEQKDLEARFEDLKVKRSEIDKQLSAIQARFNGNVRVLNEIQELMDPKEEPPTEDVKPSSDRVPVPLTPERKDKPPKA